MKNINKKYLILPKVLSKEIQSKSEVVKAIKESCREVKKILKNYDIEADYILGEEDDINFNEYIGVIIIFSHLKEGEIYRNIIKKIKKEKVLQIESLEEFLVKMNIKDNQTN